MTDTNTAKAPAKGAKSSAPRTTKQNAAAKPSRLDELQTLLVRDEGASITEMIEQTGWQQHSVRGALAGSLKKRGLTITSEKVEGVRRYRAAVPA